MWSNIKSQRSTGRNSTNEEWIGKDIELERENVLQ